jgi:exopolysaccharide production protein ExoQ
VLLVGAGIATLFDRQQPLVFRLLSLPLMPVGFYFATHVDSASAKVSVVALTIATLGFLILRYFTPAARWVLIGLVLVFTIPLTLVTVGMTDLTKDADQKILRSFKKDRTLTGRTLMWAKADAWIQESPIIGHGYRAFWASGSSDSVGILHYNKVNDYRLFQLHNTMKEIRVDTGWIGLILFLTTAVFFLYKTLAFALLYPSPGSAFLAALYLMTISFTPFGTIIGVFYTLTAQFYLCGTAASSFL